MISIPPREHFSGCLVGQCLGDALGFPVEGWPPETCSQYVQQALAPFRESGAFSERSAAPFGQYTDDSQLARELMQSYAAQGRFDPEDYARRIAAIFTEGRIVGRGAATDAAARRLAQGTPWEEAGTPPPHAGNGSAMRAGPVGLIFAGDVEQLIQAAHDQSRITHKDRRCSAGAVAIAGAVALALRPGEVVVESFVRQLSQWVRAIDAQFAGHVLQLSESVNLTPEQAAPLISRCGPPDFEDDWKWISPFVVPSVLWSLYSFLRTPEDYWETISTAIEVGGDVDTTAAMAGAISGAHLGLNRLPLGLARRLTDQGTWGFSELAELAHLCYEVRQKQHRK
jgi:poly(ADP-ribose) glycohydrolase ARH3